MSEYEGDYYSFIEQGGREEDFEADLAVQRAAAEEIRQELEFGRQVWVSRWGEVQVSRMPPTLINLLRGAPKRKDGRRLDMRYGASKDAHRSIEEFMRARFEWHSAA